MVPEPEEYEDLLGDYVWREDAEVGVDGLFSCGPVDLEFADGQPGEGPVQHHRAVLSAVGKGRGPTGAQVEELAVEKDVGEPDHKGQYQSIQNLQSHKNDIHVPPQSIPH